MVELITRATLAKDRPRASFKPGLDLRQHLKVTEQAPGRTVVEFISTDNFNKAWYERQRYEVDAGRDEEPLLYTSIYPVTQDASLPRLVPIYRLGPAGVVFEEVTEGGEVKFVTVSQSNLSVPIKHYAAGIEYTKDLVAFNELWAMADVERQFGTAHNALLNHLHFYPILNGSYAAANQTAASAVGSTLVEKYLRTIEDAITAASTDTSNPRRGPYTLLISSSNRFTMERALGLVPQEGFTLQSSAIGQIQRVVVYDGWVGTRGKKSTTYSGVTANKAYLIDMAYRGRNFKAFEKQPLQSASGGEDVSRFVLEQTIYDTYFGLYADVTAAVEEVTLPTS